ncbi:Uncharacterised protein [Mycobacterium tuberculosis]|uniref:Uncharacterized protein n=1 Tax=Mycobacterium tuberculosis TaxID=1773 RepID=A0A655FWH0_MYCTX|nr:Uncharacterised protein [Mycobacterium tuberculosis]
MLSTSRRNVNAWSAPSSPARAMKARMSLGKQPPPKPKPALRHWRPIRGSYPSASASWLTSAPAASHTSEIALINEILVARKALADTLTNSAVCRSVTRNGTPAASSGAYSSRTATSARVESSCTPRTIRSGLRVSCTAKPSRRNSGFQAISTSTPRGASAPARCPSSAAVPTGTVDLPTRIDALTRRGTSASMTAWTCRRSAPYSPIFCGVPTPRKCTSAKSAAMS